MKKYLFLTTLLVAIMCSCTDEPNNTENSGDNQGSSSQGSSTSYTLEQLEGVWEESTGSFISFTRDGFCCFYLASEPQTIESGKYYVSGTTIKVDNAYFGKTISMNVEGLKNNTLKLQNIQYYTRNDEIRFGSMSAKKSNKQPAEKDNALIGRSYKIGVRNSGGDFLWYKTTEFLTYNSGKMTADRGNAQKYPLYMYYFYLDGNIYYQQFDRQSNIQVPSIGAWNTYCGGEYIYKAPVTINSNGSIDIGSSQRLK